jgi:pimeloyl-ACP methyl ester carboxylesterase
MDKNETNVRRTGSALMRLNAGRMVRGRRVCWRDWRVTAGLLLLLFAPGCGLSRLAANRVVAAPNLHQRGMLAAWNSTWTNLLTKMTTNRLVLVTIPVGPPEATLNAMEVPPRDYHTKFVSTMQQKADGHGTFSLRWEPEPRDTFRPREHAATIIVLHGYGLMKESMAPWSFLLAQAGFRVVALDLRGHGQSTGTQIGFGKFETKDLSQALDYLQAQGLCDDKVGVLGLSYGATLALNWAAQDRRVDTVVAIAPYNQPEEAIARFAEMTGAQLPKRLVRSATGAAAAKLELKWKEWAAEAGLRRLDRPVLLIGGEKDPISRPADIAALQQAAAGEARTLQVPGADHFVVGMCFNELSEPITAWFRQRL